MSEDIDYFAPNDGKKNKATCAYKPGVIQKGDHISFQMSGAQALYFHHGIVSERNESDIKIIHFGPGQNSKNEGQFEEISVEAFLGDATDFYVKCYENDNDEKRKDVVIKAKEWMKRELDYNFITNNCENFAEFCWTGKM